MIAGGREREVIFVGIAVWNTEPAGLRLLKTGTLASAKHDFTVFLTREGAAHDLV